VHASPTLTLAGCFVNVTASVLYYCAIHDELISRLRSGGWCTIRGSGLCLADELGEDGVNDGCVPRLGFGVVVEIRGGEGCITCLWKIRVSTSLSFSTELEERRSYLDSNLLQLLVW